ncbi:MAG: hypothetical protein JRI25_28245 [Deltaproteobacteria bacterium]|nr:hypothetical protein [Deltaproteobacteria bacterium]
MTDDDATLHRKIFNLRYSMQTAQLMPDLVNWYAITYLNLELRKLEAEVRRRQEACPTESIEAVEAPGGAGGVEGARER